MIFRHHFVCFRKTGTVKPGQTTVFAMLGYNIIAISVVAAGRLNPMIAAAAMGMSSVSVVTNSLRLQWGERYVVRIENCGLSGLSPIYARAR